MMSVIRPHGSINNYPAISLIEYSWHVNITANVSRLLIVNRSLRLYGTHIAINGDDYYY